MAVLTTPVTAVFLPANGHDFIIFDNDVHVTENPWVRRGLTGAGRPRAFTSVGCGASWHPLTWVSHMLDVELYGFAPSGHRLTSVALHAVAAALLYTWYVREPGLARHRGVLLAFAAALPSKPMAGACRLYCSFSIVGRSAGSAPSPWFLRANPG
jgi:hypothetical protein